MKIKIVQSFGVHHRTVKAGDIYDARKLNREGASLDPTPNFQIVDGPASGVILPYRYAIVLDEEPQLTVSQRKELTDLNEAALKQNRLLKGQLESSRNETNHLRRCYESLFKDRGSKKEQLDQSLADIAEHGRTIDSLRQELAQEREGKEVALPKEVADAITFCKHSLSGFQIISHLGVIEQLFRDYQQPILDALKIIRHYVRQCPDGERTLFSALAGGYTVEKSPEEQFAEGITQICSRFDDEHPDDVEYEDLVSFAFEISDFAQKHNKS